MENSVVEDRGCLYIMNRIDRMVWRYPSENEDVLVLVLVSCMTGIFKWIITKGVQLSYQNRVFSFVHENWSFTLHIYCDCCDYGGGYDTLS